MQEQNETNLKRAPAWRAFRAAAPQTLPVFAGYLVLGLGYGIYVQSLGLPVWLPPLMGTVVYGGSLEFVLASLLLDSFGGHSATSGKAVETAFHATFATIGAIAAASSFIFALVDKDKGITRKRRKAA